MKLDNLCFGIPKHLNTLYTEKEMLTQKITSFILQSVLIETSEEAGTQSGPSAWLIWLTVYRQEL
jgi:hypothetical protein